MKAKYSQSIYVTSRGNSWGLKASHTCPRIPAYAWFALAYAYSHRRLLVCRTSAFTTHIMENIALYISYILLELEVFRGQQLGQEMTDSLASM